MTRVILVVVLVSLGAAPTSHVTGGYVYPNVGWRSIATGGSDFFAINPLLPPYNNAGADTWAASRQATDAWNATRTIATSAAYITEVSWIDPNNHIQFNDLGTGLGVIDYRLNSSDACVTGLYPGVQCKQVISLGDQDWLVSDKLVGGLVHELGHALGSLGDHLVRDCTTIMSTCWDTLTQPQPNDIATMKTIYGIPDSLSLIKLNNVGLVRVSALNRSTYNSYYRFDLWKLNGSQSIYLHSHTVAGPFPFGVTVSFEENLLSEGGPALYTYGVYVHQSFFNGESGDQFGGFTNWLQVDQAPYRTFLPIVLRDY
ncbi:MAG: hypothetical protein HY259_15040, partial [Chloroflexi bacterium]|nr:hypothetical protein [Chloroflexota bacterium]